MPAALAFKIVGRRASGLGVIPAIPSTLASIAAWISVACLVTSPSPEYSKSTLSLAAAAFAPLMMVSKNASPAGAWLIIAIFMGGVVAAGPAPELSLLLGAAPPPLHAAVITSRAAIGAVIQTRFGTVN